MVVATSFEVAVLAGGVRALLCYSSCPAREVVVVTRLLMLLGAVASIVPLMIKAACALMLLIGVVPFGASTLSSSIPVLVGSLHCCLLVPCCC